MSLAKVIEVLAEGDTIEKATEAAVAEASKSVRNIKHVYVKDLQALVKDGSVQGYRANCKVTFVLD
ncbi:MAG TPA: dodecin family protein [Longimicrobiales bacterium]|nr:dodecin family protein [Longimicrobiales bacterium]